MQKHKSKKNVGLGELFLAFARVGVMTFGGGYAMLPIIQREIVENKGWASQEEVMDYYAVGQCTPGVIAVNTATFVGQSQRGIAGGIVATLGVVFPALLIIMFIAGVIRNFSDLMVVKNAFAGIRVCVCVLILNAVIKLGKSAITDLGAAVIFGVVLVGSLALDLSPVLYVPLAAGMGILFRFVRRKGGKA